MENLPLVSVIMPVYNAEKYISKAIESILNQTYSNLEILIADDASTDKSREIIDSFNDKRIKRFHNETNLGYLKTCNKLFELTSGGFITFQDADDWSELNRIELTIDFLLNNESVVICGCNFIRLQERSKKITTQSNYPTTDNEIKKYIEQNNNLPFCGASVIVKKLAYYEIGGYQVYFDRIGNEHFDWFLRISEKFQVANITNPSYNYRYTPNSFSRTDKLTNYKKFYSNRITFFLKTQRTKYGFDALQNQELEPEFTAFHEQLEKEFWNNRFTVYRSVVLQMAGNASFKSAYKISKQGLNSKEIGLQQFFNLLYRIIRSFLAFRLKSLL